MTASFGGAALLFAAAATTPASSAELQQRFLEAIALVEQGRAQEGAALLRELYAVAPTPRIRLELARALMLAEQWKEARQLFIEAFKDGAPPVVNANILNLISRIDRRRGKLSLSASVARYGNPLQQPGAYTLNFAGIELTYEADNRYRNVWGVTFGSSYSKEFSNGWQLAASASYRELPYNEADRLTGDLSIARQIGRLPLEAKVGVTRLGQPGQSFTLPYAQASYTLPLTKQIALRPAVTLGYYAADVGKSASGFQADAFLPVVYAPLPTKFLAVGPTVLKHMAGYHEQAYTSLGIRAVSGLQTGTVNVEIGVQGTITRFDAVNPFWGVRRRDRSFFASAMVSSYKARLGPFVPAFGLMCNVTGSTVSYYRQQGCDTQFEIRKIF